MFPQEFLFAELCRLCWKQRGSSILLDRNTTSRFLNEENEYTDRMTLSE